MRAPARTDPPGLVIVNPPYGERLGTPTELVHLYTVLGERLRHEFAGWHAAVFTADAPLGKRLGLRARRKYEMFNGALPCTLLLFDIPTAAAQASVAAPVRPALSEGAAMFANRLRKNLRHWSKWAKREGIECYRVYDADLPDYACAIDVYGDQVNVQEYQAPKTIDPDKARLRRDEVLVVVPEVFGIPPKQVHYRLRQRQRGKEQYQKLGARSSFHEVREGPVRCLVNLAEYLDTGLFLDHRLTRQLVGRLANGRRVLNLFCYTGTATLHAALGGAVSTTSVDMSQRYLDWAAENLALNGLDTKRHRLIRTDVLAWLEKERGEYDLIFLDPPTFSNSKRMEDDFDVLRDHVELITVTMARLAPGGILIFSNNHQRFKLDAAGLSERLGPLDIEDLTKATLPEDFARSPRIHRCYKITKP
jgi:23S rRNA (guanine2445-N2)-methyltransferase / 23S rRNA (guanine2069-N7)-methyltransferase